MNTELVKLAFAAKAILRNRLLLKQATAKQEFFRGIGGDVLTGGPLSGTSALGTLSGLYSKSPESEEELKAMLQNYQDDVSEAFVPGTAKHREARRRKAVATALNKDKRFSNILSELAGGATSTLASGLAGAGIGYGVDRLGRNSNNEGAALVGGLVGLGAGGLANIVGRLSGKLGKKRSKKEQKEYEDSNKWKNWLIPGVARYNYAAGANASDALLD